MRTNGSLPEAYGIEALNVYCGGARISVQAIFQGRRLDSARMKNLEMKERSIALPWEDPRDPCGQCRQAHPGSSEPCRAVQYRAADHLQRIGSGLQQVPGFLRPRGSGPGPPAAASSRSNRLVMGRRRLCS